LQPESPGLGPSHPLWNRKRGTVSQAHRQSGHATMDVARGNRQSQSRTGVEAIIDRRLSLRMLIHSIMSVSLK
jgi:hypothetical protein